MKIFISLILALLISGPLLAEGKMKKEITDSFTDKVKNITVEENEIVVRFALQAALYKVKKTNPKFEEIKTKLDKFIKEEKKATVTAVVPSMEIKEITE